jgi:hypothetical protein
MARGQGQKADLNRRVRGCIVRFIMVPLMLAVVMREGKKEVGMGHSRMLRCAM